MTDDLHDTHVYILRAIDTLNTKHLTQRYDTFNFQIHHANSHSRPASMSFPITQPTLVPDDQLRVMLSSIKRPQT